MARKSGGDATEYWARYSMLCTHGKDFAVYQGTGISQSTFSSWKIANKFPPSDKAVIIAERLGTTVEYMVTGNPEYRFTTGKISPLAKSISEKIMSMKPHRVEQILELIDTWSGIDIERASFAG